MTTKAEAGSADERLKRVVTFNGATYRVRSNNIAIPDLASMDRFAALMWLNKHTHARGYSKTNPLAGFAGAVSVNR